MSPVHWKKGAVVSPFQAPIVWLPTSHMLLVHDMVVLSLKPNSAL